MYRLSSNSNRPVVEKQSLRHCHSALFSPPTVLKALVLVATSYNQALSFLRSSLSFPFNFIGLAFFFTFLPLFSHSNSLSCSNNLSCSNCISSNFTCCSNVKEDARETAAEHAVGTALRHKISSCSLSCSTNFPTPIDNARQHAVAYLLKFPKYLQLELQEKYIFHLKQTKLFKYNLSTTSITNIYIEFTTTQTPTTQLRYANKQVSNQIQNNQKSNK